MRENKWIQIVKYVIRLEHKWDERNKAEIFGHKLKALCLEYEAEYKEDYEDEQL